MNGRIFNANTYGQYDFFNQCIELNVELFGISESHAQKVIDTKNPYMLTGDDLQFYSTYLHELTHFYDCNSTIWGMEFILRIHRCFKLPNSSQALEVVNVNDSEIAMHNYMYEERCSHEILEYDGIKYGLDYDEVVGPHLKICYLSYQSKFEEIIATVPVSMLALLEGHAYAQELLFKLKAYEHQRDWVSKSLLITEVEKSLKYANTVEYTCLIALTFVLFPDLSLKNKLELIITLSKLSLNASTIMTSSIPVELLEKVFQLSDKVLLQTLQTDLARGQNRAAFFILILMYIAYLEDLGKLEREVNFTELIEKYIFGLYSPGLNSEDIVSSMMTVWDIEYDAYSKELKTLNTHLTADTAQEMRDKNWYSFDLYSLKTPDIFCSSGSMLSSENRLDIDLEEHFNQVAKPAIKLENQLKATGPHKFHNMTLTWNT